ISYLDILALFLLRIRRPPASPLFPYTTLFRSPYARYTPAIAAPPAGSDLIDEWEIYWGLAKRLGLDLVYDGVPLDMATKPTTDRLLAIVARHAPVPFAQIKADEMGGIYEGTPQYVGPASDGHSGRFTVAPDDIVAELR